MPKAIPHQNTSYQSCQLPFYLSQCQAIWISVQILGPSTHFAPCTVKKK